MLSGCLPAQSGSLRMSLFSCLALQVQCVSLFVSFICFPEWLVVFRLSRCVCSCVSRSLQVWLLVSGSSCFAFTLLAAAQPGVPVGGILFDLFTPVRSPISLFMCLPVWPVWLVGLGSPGVFLHLFPFICLPVFCCFNIFHSVLLAQLLELCVFDPRHTGFLYDFLQVT